ncbi:bifunctional DNA-formamidopyrimidine glycosylase/DNA-(apurinic or apyrimidinic site) lyase [Psychrobacter sp. FDAARGOS_221]|uniref:bifunctional DNA-formamidopyrimidine glycosylase/DNA-(apurinic or apyrimidinic site) lyase n=1 Tax=Psychrobacter sp. FDAARGOS_221 TaxID=1975705 RepID=UPI000BB5352A|nr:bifunctional DNA-formamidopyrimidine glycosylase/DNA-(apurinic or apyrimidinic site) lyase [Psychrobacter sp. FDAARGOS_221]PNK60373.1 bifunctional DNA-formamidopyrimidine glycosylase/DNA-(apurinic or apyrimidinic site) lyase [Psychrobacter sp. FDAARGOS_221]
MPELPEVETTKVSLTPLLNQQVAKVDVFQPKLRWPVPNDLAQLEGYQLKQVSRRAKYLILQFQRDSDNQDSLVLDKNKPQYKSVIIHLGMSGSLQQFEEGSDKRKHDHLILHFQNPQNPGADKQLHYHDPRRFGALLWFDDYADRLFSHLGAEPLSEEFNASYLYNRIHRIAENKERGQSNKKALKPISRPIKSVIMDQVVVVGVGNIYATESLFLSHIHPSTPADQLSKTQLETLTKHIRAILQRAIEKGGSSLRDFKVASDATGYFQQTLLVYGKHKEPCPTCGTDIDKVVINGRASTFCPECQPL